MVLMSCGVGLCSVLTPYYNEDVLYSLEQLKERNVDGITMLYYLKTIVPGLCSDVGMPNAGADSCDPFMCPYLTRIAGSQLYFLHSNNGDEIFANCWCWMKTFFGMCTLVNFSYFEFSLPMLSLNFVYVVASQMNGRTFLNGWTQRPNIVSWVISQKRVFLMPENYVFGHLIEVKLLHAQVSPRCDQCPQLWIPNLAPHFQKIFQSVFRIFLIADLIYLWRLTGLHIFRVGGTFTNRVVEKFLIYLTYS